MSVAYVLEWRHSQYLRKALHPDKSHQERMSVPRERLRRQVPLIRDGGLVHVHHAVDRVLVRVAGVWRLASWCPRRDRDPLRLRDVG